MTDTLTPSASVPDPWSDPNARRSASPEIHSDLRSDAMSYAPVDPSDLTDVELCSRIRVHTTASEIARAAFAELYSRHWAPALHFSLRLIRDRARAEDAVAEAFAKIWRAWGHGTGPTESFKSYLLTAVRSESGRRTVTRAATTTVTPEVLTALAGSSTDDQAAALAERDQLARAFATLPESWREAITLIDIDGSPTAEAAAALDLSPNSFSSLLRRAREGLRTSYLQEHVEPGPPDCTQYSSLLARHVRGQLGIRESKSLRAHLRRCRRCRAQSEYLTGLNTQLRAGFAPAVIAAALLGVTQLPASPFLAEVAAGGAATAGTGAAAGGTAGGLAASGLATGAGLMTAAQAIAGVAAAAAIAVTAIVSIGASSAQQDPLPVAAPIPVTAPASPPTDHAGRADAGESAPQPTLDPAAPAPSASRPAAGPAAVPQSPAATSAPTAPVASPSTPASVPPPSPAEAESPSPADTAPPADGAESGPTAAPIPTTAPAPTATSAPEPPVEPTSPVEPTNPEQPTTATPEPTADPTPTSAPDPGTGLECHRHHWHWHCHP